MDCKTGVRTLTPLPKKRFQRLCLKKNINSCPPKSVQSQNKENEQNVSLEKASCNMSGRLSSPGYRVEHSTTPTFVTVRKPRHLIPSPLTTSDSNLDSDTSQIFISGYFQRHSPPIDTNKSLLAFSTPIGDNVSKVGMDEIKETHNNVLTETTNFENRKYNMTKQNKIDFEDIRNNTELEMFTKSKDFCDDTTPKNNILIESLKIFDKNCSAIDNSISHLIEHGYKTPENSGNVLRQLTPKTASIMDNLYGDVWKTTPGLFKKTKSRIDYSQRVPKISVNDDNANEIDLQSSKIRSTTDTKKKRLSQSTIKRFFKSSSNSEASEVMANNLPKVLTPTNIHFDIIDNVYILKDCLKNMLNIQDNGVTDNIALNDFNGLTNDKLPEIGMHSDVDNSFFMRLDTNNDNRITNFPSGNGKNHVSSSEDIIDLTDLKIFKDLKTLKTNSNQENNVIHHSLNYLDNCFKADVNSKQIRSKDSGSKINYPDVMTDNNIKNTSEKLNDSTDTKKPTRQNVNENLIVNIDRVINRKASLKDLTKLKNLKLKEDIKGEASKIAVRTDDFRIKVIASSEIKTKNSTKIDSIAENKYEEIKEKKKKNEMNDTIEKVNTVKKLTSNAKILSGREPKSMKHKDIDILLQKPNDTVSKRLVLKKKDEVKPKAKDFQVGAKITQQKNFTTKNEEDNSDVFDSLTNKDVVRINSNLDNSCEIMSTRKKKINCFPDSSDSENDSDRKLQNLHFNLEPKKLVFGASGNESDAGKNKKKYPDTGGMKKIVKKSVKERNSSKNLASIGAKIPVSDDLQVYSFMASLADNVPSWRCDPDAKCFKLNFKAKRDELTKKLFIMFNENVFESKLPVDLPIVWSVNLTKTAGIARNKVVKHRSKPNEPVNISRKSQVELSAKVLDGPQRLRNTLAHELCHVATWLIDGQLKDGHGPCWKSWVARTLKRYPELVALPVCHTLDIHFKYTYKCMKCGYSIGRHSKSIDTERKRCGYCYGALECIHNKKNKDGLVVSIPVGQKRQATGFALYVKENYGNVRGNNTPHKDAMKYLGMQYAKMKISNQENTDGK